jgi:hypothetical protein
MSLRAVVLASHPIEHILLPILRMATRIRQVQHALADLSSRQSRPISSHRSIASLPDRRTCLSISAPGRIGNKWTYVIDSLSVCVGGELEEDNVDDRHGYLFTCLSWTSVYSCTSDSAVAGEKGWGRRENGIGRGMSSKTWFKV